MADCETQALLEDLERAECGSRELDARIELDRRVFIAGAAAFVGWVANPAFDKGRVNGWLWDGKHLASQVEAPHYTTSIDAALTLVPAEYYLFEAEENFKGGGWMFLFRKREMGNPRTDAEGIAATPALALCIASLRARSTAAGEAGE